MSVDVEIYMNNIIKFFRENEKDLLNLVPKDKEEEFYVKIRETAFKNYDKGNEVGLTQKQLIEICVELNTKKDLPVEKIDKTIVKTKFGYYSLN
jgi:hypothetical protein